MKLLTPAVVFCVSLPAMILAETSVHPPQKGGTAMKPVICKVVEEARGKTGQELAAALEIDGARLAASNYELVAIVSEDPPIACYRGRVDPSKLPPGTR